MNDPVDAKTKLHERYRLYVQNGVPAGQAQTVAAFHLRALDALAKDVARSIDFVNDVAQSIAEEQTLNGAPTERVLRIRRVVSYTTTPETPGA